MLRTVEVSVTPAKISGSTVWEEPATSKWLRTSPPSNSIGLKIEKDFIDTIQDGRVFWFPLGLWIIRTDEIKETLRLSHDSSLFGADGEILQDQHVLVDFLQIQILPLVDHRADGAAFV